jgi:hypothetical protein
MHFLERVIEMNVRWNCCVSSALIASLLFVASASAQRRPESTKAQLLEAVVRYRQGFMGDTTKFSTCTVYAVLEKPSGFPSAVSLTVRSALDRDVGECMAGEAMLPRIGVLVDSVSVLDSTATVSVTVWRDELRHLEDYTLVRSDLAARIGTFPWMVRGVRLFGSIRVQRGGTLRN